MLPNPHQITQNVSHLNKDLFYSLIRALAQGQTPTLLSQKCTFSHAYMQVQYVKTHIYTLNAKAIHQFVYINNFT